MFGRMQSYTYFAWSFLLIDDTRKKSNIYTYTTKKRAQKQCVCIYKRTYIDREYYPKDFAPTCMSTAFLSETSTDKYFYVGLKFEVTCSACTSRGSADDMMAIVTRCHFWWNNFFFLLLSFSPLFSRITTRLLLTTTYTYIHANATASAQKMRFFFFLFFFFYSILLLSVWCRDCTVSRWCSCFSENDKTTRKKKTERSALVLALVALPATLYFCQLRLYAYIHVLLFVYTCHCTMFHERRDTCTKKDEIDADRSVPFNLYRNLSRIALIKMQKRRAYLTAVQKYWILIK